MTIRFEFIASTVRSVMGGLTSTHGSLGWKDYERLQSYNELKGG
jgi:hypothetical protein